MTNTKRKDRAEEFLKILKPIGFSVYGNSPYREQFYHEALGSNNIIDLSAMADTSTVVQKIFNSGVIEGMERQAKQIREILQIDDSHGCSCEMGIK